MKTKKLLFLGVFGASFLQAQVGIGTTTVNTSAALEMSSNSRGLLIPRLTTTEMNNIASPATGLLVFNTDSQFIYAFDGTNWTQDVFSPSTRWNTIGNNTTANIIGTTNNIPFNIRTNNNLALSILANAQVRIGDSNLSEPRLTVNAASVDTSIPTIYLNNSNGNQTSNYAISAITTNEASSGSVFGTYAFATSITDANEGTSVAGISYVNDPGVSGISIYTGGHPTDIDDRSKEVMMITPAKNVGIGRHIPNSRLQIGDGDLYISDPNSGIIIKDTSGTCRRITVDDTGALVVSAAITCP